MESKISTLATIFLLFTNILIQVTVAPPPEDEKIANVNKSKIQKFFTSKDYLATIRDVFETAKKSTSEAKDKVQAYSTKKLPEDLKKLLEGIADKPHEVWDEMKPLLEDMNDKLKEIDKKAQEESVVYRVVGRPLWTLISGIGYLSAGGMGYAMQTVGGLLQLFNDGVNEGVNGYEGKDAEPNKQAGKVYKTIDSKLETFKGWGSGLGNAATEKLMKNHFRGLRRNKSAKKESTSDATRGEGVEPGSPAKPAETGTSEMP